MRQLSVGDVVRTGAGYEPITSFLHAQRASQLDFLSLAFTDDASEFVLSAAHRVFLRTGESIMAYEAKVIVIFTFSSIKSGIYMHSLIYRIFEFSIIKLKMWLTVIYELLIYCRSGMS